MSFFGSAWATNAVSRDCFSISVNRTRRRRRRQAIRRRSSSNPCPDRTPARPRRRDARAKRHSARPPTFRRKTRAGQMSQTGSCLTPRARAAGALSLREPARCAGCPPVLPRRFNPGGQPAGSRECRSDRRRRGSPDTTPRSTWRRRDSRRLGTHGRRSGAYRDPGTTH